MNTQYQKKNTDSKKELMLERLQHYFKQNKLEKSLAASIKI